LTYTIAGVDDAFAAAKAYMTDDPDGLVQGFDAVDLLASEPLQLERAGVHGLGAGQVQGRRTHAGERPMTAGSVSHAWEISFGGPAGPATVRS
jgi:hypothetical protein